MFVIEDEMHAESVGTFTDHAGAIAELRRLATIPWDQAPNQCPCTNWQNCARRYHLIEYDVSAIPWRPIGDVASLEVSAAGTHWLADHDG